MTSYWGLYGSAAKLGTSVSGGKALDVTKETSLGSNVSVKMTFTGMQNANIIRVGYEFKNAGSSTQKVSVGGTVDTDIAGDDYAKIETFESGNSEGLISTARGGEYISFSIDKGDDNNGYYWYGKWTSSEKNDSTFASFIQKANGCHGKDPSLSTRDGSYDSCMSWLWTGVNVPAGKTVTKYCYWGVGDLTAGDDPKEIETAAAPATVVWDANAGGDTVTGLPANGRSATDNDYYVALPTPVRNGYLFEGWYDQAAGGNKITGDPAHSNKYKTEENIILYAHWKAIVSTININLFMGDTPFKEQTVQLYQDGRVKHSLTEGFVSGSGTTGVYSVDRVVNGTYDVAVNGIFTGDKVNVAATTSQSTWTKTVDVRLQHAKVNTKLDGVLSNAPGTVTLCQNGKVVGTLRNAEDGQTPQEGVWETGILIGNNANASFDICVGGVDTGKKLTSSKLEETIEFFTVKVNVTDDKAWDTANVTLRNASGKTVASLPLTETNGSVTTYSKILQKSDTECIVDVGGINTGKTIKVGATNDNTINLTFYTATLNVTCSDAVGLPMQATMTGDGRSYVFKKGEVSGNTVPYTVEHVLAAMTSGSAYTVKTTGVSKEGVEGSLIISENDKTKNITVNVVNFKKYTQSTADNSKYDVDDSGIKEYVINGGKVKGTELYLSGYTFDDWSEESWTDENKKPKEGTSYTPFDFKQGITADKTLYPHYLPPTVKINGIIRTDANGVEVPKGTDTAYRLGNLSITGFDKGDQAIKYVILNGEKISKIEARNAAAYGAVYDNTAGIIEFSPLVSMAKAQEYIRKNVIVTPDKDAETDLPVDGFITVTVIDKNGKISSATTGDPARDNTQAKKLTSGSKTLNGGFYYVDESVSCNNTSAGGSGLTINGTVYIYIKSGCKLTAKGANASNQTGGGAGIQVSEGNTLYLLGEGSVVATGGNAANGSAGNAGSGSSFNDSEDKVYLGAGGKGGAGGGGAGAGIGTSGGTGGNGGEGGQGWSTDKDHDTKKQSEDRGYNQGYDGSDGSQGSAAGTAGTMYILIPSGKYTANSGAAGTSGGSGGANGGKGMTDKGDERCYSGGAGGGGGGAGYAGQGIGAGGNGGSGGGGGASAGYCFKLVYIGGGAGAGGAGAVAGIGGTNGHSEKTGNGDGEKIDDWGSGPSGTTGGTGAKGHCKPDKGKEDYGFGGNGGNGGTKKNNGGNGTIKNSGTVNQSFNISVVAGSHGSTVGTLDATSYAFGSEKSFTLPSFAVSDSKYFFRGWKLTTYGVEFGSTTDNPLTSGAGTIYAPGKTFTTTRTMAGQLVFTAITSERTGLYATDTAAYNATKMKTYTVTTKVYGQPKDVGQLTFTYKDASGHPVSESVTGLNGVYTFSTTVNNVTVKHGTEVVAEMTTTEEDLTAEATANFETLRVTVTGYKPSDVTLQLADDPVPVLTRVSEDDTKKIYVYETAYRLVPEGGAEYLNYQIRVDGTDVHKTAKYGENTTVAYHTLIVKLAPSKARNVILKDRDGNQLVTEKVGSGESDTFVYTALEDRDTVYDVYADGTLTGATGVKLDSTREIEASYYLTKVTVKLDGTASDVVGNPYYGTELMMKGGIGIYSYASADSTAHDVILSGEVAKTEFAPGHEVELNYYSIIYEKNVTAEQDTPETGNVPAPTYCLAGGKAHLSACAIRKGVQRFAGWTIGDMTYSAGSEISISATTHAKPAWEKISLNELDKNGKGVTVIFDKAVFGYDGTSQIPNIKVYYGTYSEGDIIPEGFSVGDDRMLATGSAYRVTFKNDNPATGAGDDTVRAGTVTVFIAGIGDYSGVVTKTYQILPRLVHLKGITATKTFDGTTGGVTLNYSGAKLEGKITNDDLGYDESKIEGYVDTAGIELDEDGNILSKPLRIKIKGQTDPDNIDILLTGAKKSDYALAGNITGANGEEISVTMEKKSIMPTEIRVYDKAYDGTRGTTIIKGSIKFDERFVSADVAKSFFISGTANFNDPNVGKDKPVTITNMVLLGADGKPELNYTLSSQRADPDIVKPAEIVKASQLAPAPGEGYRLENGSIIIDLEASIRETNYEIHWVKPNAGEGEPKEGFVEAGESIAVTEGIDYYIRWKENNNYQSSSYTKVITDIPTGKLIASLPETKKGLVYNGSEQTGVNTVGIKGFTWVSGTTATNAGEYTATATLQYQNNYLWPDGTGDDEETRTREVKWVIAKSPQTEPYVYVADDPQDLERKDPEDVFIYPAEKINNPTTGQAYVVYDGQAYRKIEYSKDGGRSWKSVLSANDETPGIFRDITPGETYLFRYAGDDNHEPSPAKPVVKGDKLYTPVTKAPTNITSTGAVLHAEIEKFSSGDVLGFRYREKGTGNWTEKTDVASTFTTGKVITFSRELTELSDNKLYEYKSFVRRGTVTQIKEKEGKTLSFHTGTSADGEITVTITTESQDQIDVLVTVEKGNDAIDSRGCKTSFSSPGSVRFSGLPNGHYNVVVRTSDYTDTRMLSVTSEQQNVSSVFSIPIGKLATVVDIKDNAAPKVAVEGLDGILTEDDRNKAAQKAKDVEVKLEVENAVEKPTGPGATEMEKETQAGIREIKGLASAAKVVVKQFIDMNLFKTTAELDADGNTEAIDVQNIGKTNTKVIEIAIPFVMNRMRDVFMYRYHDDGKDDDTNKAKELEALPKRSAAGVFKDGTYFVDKAAGYIFVYASGFSTFAICTTGEGGNPGGGSSGGGGGGVVDPDDPVDPDKKPKIEERASNIIPVKNGVEGYGAVEIYSLTSKENTELSGAVFALYNEEGEEVGRGSTLDGYMRFINVGKGTYTYREILAPEGYKLLGKEGRVTITDTKKEVVIYILHAAEDQPGEPEEETKALTIEDILSLLTDAEREIIKDLMARYGIDEMEAIRFYMQTRMYGVTEDCMNITPDMITSRTTDKDIEGSEFGKLRARSKKSSKKKIALKWTKVGFADGYMVFGSRCNVKGKKFKQKLFTTTTDNETLSYKVKKLKKGTYYKFTVIAYKNLGSGKVTTAVSKVVHMATKGGKFTNPKKIKLKSKKSIKIREKRLKKTKVRVIPMKKRKKLPAHRALSYESSDKSIATVTWNGRIVGVSKGTCKVFVYAQNGIYKVIKVKVTP